MVGGRFWVLFFLVMCLAYPSRSEAGKKRRHRHLMASARVRLPSMTDVLPLDTLIHIMGHLEAQDLLKLTRTSRVFAEPARMAMGDQKKIDLSRVRLTKGSFLKGFGIGKVFAQVKHLNLSKAKLKFDFVSLLPSTLQTLELHSMNIGDAGLERAAFMTELRALGLSNNHITAYGATLLQQFPHLESLDLSWNNICDDGARTLAERNNEKSEESAESEESGPIGLRRLNLSHNHITDEGALALGSMHRLEVLVLSGNNISRETKTALRTALPNTRIAF